MMSHTKADLLWVADKLERLYGQAQLAWYFVFEWAGMPTGLAEDWRSNSKDAITFQKLSK